MTAVRYEQTSGIVHLILDRPEVRNAISDAMIADLVAAVARMNADRSVRCVVLSGNGANFSAGGDIRNMKTTIDKPGLSAADVRTEYLHGIQQIPLAFARLEVPAIAAVHGHAIGAGCDLTLMCDIRIAADDAKFAESFAKMGLISGDGGAWLLPRVVGLARALEMTLTGDMIDAETARTYGLVSKVVPREQLLPEALALAGRIAALPGNVLRMTKKLMRESQAMTLPASLELAASLQALAVTGPEHREAVTAFLEKRKPVFV